MSHSIEVSAGRSVAPLLFAAMVVVASGCGSDSSAVSPFAARTLALQAPKTSIEVGESLALTVTARDGRDSLVSDAPVHWSSAPIAVATVANGVVTTHAPGTVVITATSGVATASITIDVRPTRATSILLTAPTMSLAPQEAASLAAVVRDARQATLTGTTIEWRSTDTRVVTVDNSGVMTGIASGFAYVVARADSARDSVQISVSVPAELFIAPDDVDMATSAQRVLSARFRSANGIVSVANNIVWSSSNTQIATVSNGTVAALTPGVTTITATAGALSASATVRVGQSYGNYIVSTPVTGVQGVIRADSMNITQLTASGPLTLIATGDIIITSGIIAPCFPITIIAGGKLQLVRTSEGRALTNECGNEVLPEPMPAIRVDARGGYSLRHASIRSSGDITITNDASLTAVDFSSDRVDRSTDNCQLSSVFIDQRYYPMNAPVTLNGRNGPHLNIECRGILRIVSSEMYARGGTKGGTVTQFNRAVGGAGGNSGTIRIRTSGDLHIGGQPLVLTVLSSGAGGDAVAVAPGATGASATAIGGNGGDMGSATRPPVEILAAGNVFLTLVKIDVQYAGNGGSASASGGQGAQATNTAPAGVGGAATAVGGRGGQVFPAVLPSGVSFDIFQIKLNGFVAGSGGNAAAAAARGGSGSAEFPNGGPGGAAHAQGGDGGNTSTVTNVSFARGGNAGSATVTGGTGGAGFDRCEPQGAGGIGGIGGIMSGKAGRAGTGMLPGTDALLEIWGAGIGGPGGKGSTPGSGGSKGIDETITIGPRLVDALSLANGPQGKKCE